jgi:hypothetical protein
LVKPGNDVRNPFTSNALWDIQIDMRHVVTIGSRLDMTRLGGPVEGVAH